MDALRLANSAFAVDLFKQLCDKGTTDNVLFSPICLSTSLSLAQVGTKGDTANEIGKTETKPVQMMNIEATFCMGNIKDINCKTIELPFQNKHLSMLIILPKDVEDDSTGLEKIEKELSPETLQEWTNPSTMASTKVKLSIPKFKVEKIVDPKTVLESLGMKNVFDESTSDFSGLSETKGVALSNVIHRTRLEITEDGGDSIEVPGSRILQHKDEFIADHPFIYIIRHNKTRNIIFFGKYSSP
ncbi:serpin B5 [Gracilinanus agilis]|uniref:serpin B5 n=1 Tax=Gracilinanus agilis TaxID=191870 RepID=UPI001CFDB48F|nr:serpin B5 [Gracilinanus agilis]